MNAAMVVDGKRPTLYGSAKSRALRSVWAIEETGIEWHHVPTNFMAESKMPEYLAINPNGRIPALVDGEVRLFESMAINLYLCKRYGQREDMALYPANAADEARAWQWSVWGISEIEPLQMQVVIQKLFTPDEKKDAKVVERAIRGLQRPLKVLDAELAQREWLLGRAFSVADLNLAGVMQLIGRVGIDISEHAHVVRWLAACAARPALARALARP